MKNKLPKVGIILPCFNESDFILGSIEKLNKEISEIKKKNLVSEFKICLVDDGSKDDTWVKIKSIVKNNLKLFYGIKFSKNFGHQNALYAGIEYLNDKTDCIITMDSDLEQDVTKIEEFILKYLEGNEIVLGIRNNRDEDTFFKKTTSNIYHYIFRSIGGNIIKNHADFRLISQRVAKELTNFREYNIFLRYMITDMGFKQSHVYFNVKRHPKRKSKYSFIKMFNLGLDGLTSYSIIPLRLSTIIGLLTIFFSIVMIIVIFYDKLVLNVETPGWASTVLPIYLIGGINLFFLGIIGEYIGKIFLEVKQRPKYIIEEITEET